MCLKRVAKWIIPFLVGQLVCPGCGGSEGAGDTTDNPAEILSAVSSPFPNIEAQPTEAFEALLEGSVEELVTAVEADHILTEGEYHDALLFIVLIATAETTGEMPGIFYETGIYQKALAILEKYPSLVTLNQGNDMGQMQGALFSASSDGTWTPGPNAGFEPGYKRNVGKSFVCNEVCSPDWGAAYGYAASSALWKTLPSVLNPSLKEFVELFRKLVVYAKGPLSIINNIFTNNPDYVGMALDILKSMVAISTLVGVTVLSVGALKALAVAGLVLTVAAVGNKLWQTNKLWSNCTLWQLTNCTTKTGHCPDDGSLGGLLEHQFQLEGKCIECLETSMCTGELGPNVTCDYDTYLCIQLTTPALTNNANTFVLVAEGTTYTSGNMTATAGSQGTVFTGQRDNIATEAPFFRVNLHLPAGEPNGTYPVNSDPNTSDVHIELELEQTAGVGTTSYNSFFEGGSGAIEFNQVPKAEKNALSRVTGSYEGTVRSSGGATLSIYGTFDIQDTYIW